MEEMNPVVAVKVDFECWDKSKVIAYFGIFGLSRLWWQEKVNGLICQYISTTGFKFSTEAKMEDTKPLVGELGELGVSISRWNIINSIIWNMRSSVFQWKEQNRQYYHRNCSPIKKFFIETLMKEMKPRFMGEKVGWIWTSRKTIERSLF